VFEDVGTF